MLNSFRWIQIVEEEETKWNNRKNAKRTEQIRNNSLSLLFFLIAFENR